MRYLKVFKKYIFFIFYVCLTSEALNNLHFVLWGFLLSGGNFHFIKYNL